MAATPIPRRNPWPLRWKTFGFDILETANSKSLAGGISGLRATIDLLRGNGIEPLGTYGTQAERDAGQVLLKEVNGIRIAFFAFTKGFDGMSIPSGSEYCANLLYTDYDTVYEDVAEAEILSVIEEARPWSPTPWWPWSTGQRIPHDGQRDPEGDRRPHVPQWS